MVKKALLVGLNYPNNDKLRLNSSYNDIELVEKYLHINENFNKDNIIKLTDKNTNVNFANYFNIIDNMKKIIDKSNSNDILFFYFTGHGTQLVDKNNDELDSKDEAFMPADYDKFVIGDDLFKSLFVKCPANITILFDSCHSGTAIDLKYTYTLCPFISVNKLDVKDNNNVICYSATNDSNLTFASILPDGNRHVKWFSNFTYHFIKHLANFKEKISNRDLIMSMRNDQKKTCINKAVISFSNIKIATCMFLEQYDEEIIEAAKRKLKKLSENKHYGLLLKEKLKIEKELRMKNAIIEKYKNALHQKNMPNVDNFNAILYSIKD